MCVCVCVCVNVYTEYTYTYITCAIYNNNNIKAPCQSCYFNKMKNYILFLVVLINVYIYEFGMNKNFLLFVDGQEVDLDTQKFLDEGIQRGSFLNGKWVSYPRNIPASWPCAASPEEFDALWEFFLGTGGMTTGWRFVANDKWKNDTCPCIHKWRGVVCDSVGHIVSLNLAGFGLQGAIPESLGRLVWLKSVQLQVNELTGAIPPLLGGSKYCFLSMVF